MIATTKDLIAWFEQRAGQTLHIDKMEGGDSDRVRLQLERVEQLEQAVAADAFIPRKTLRLLGEGTIHNPGEDPVALPNPAYDIVLDGLVSQTESAGSLIVETTRATYRIQ